MSLIKKQQERISALQKRVAQLEAEKQSIQYDIAFVAGKVAEVWEYMDLDFSKVSVNSEKPSFMEMTKATMPIIKKIVGGKIKIPFIVSKFEEVAPTLNKYKHLVVVAQQQTKELPEPPKQIGNV